MSCSLHSQVTKVALIGAGNVGSTAAYALMMDDIVTEIALIDVLADKAVGEALDLEHGIQFSTTHSITGGSSYELVKNAQIVVVTAGLNQKPGQSRRALLVNNAALMSTIIPEIVRYNKDCILLMVTNPVDVMTYAAWKFSGLPADRVIGTGTVLDTARLRAEISGKIGVSAKDICAYVIGEHGDSELVAWSHATVAGLPLAAFPHWKREYQTAIETSVRDAAYKVIEKKGMTNFAIGLVIAKIIRALLTDQTRIFSVSTINQGMFDAPVLSVPTIINRCGVVASLKFELSPEEQILVERAQQVVSADVAELTKCYYW